ncbi:MAG: dihydrofolate reductase [Balneolaceae bacterium]
MKLAIIAAHDPGLLIGKEGALPWHYREDMEWFKRVTTGHTVIMGRGVFEELGEKPLPGRRNVVLSRTRNYSGVVVCRTISDALESVRNEDLAFVIGGAEIYSALLNRVDELYITEIHKEYSGDTWFPEYRDRIGSEFKEVYREHGEQITFVKYRRTG